MNDDDDEIKSFITVWIVAITSLSYSYYISSKIPPGLYRFFSLLPIFSILTLLPLNLHSFHLCGPTTFFLVWLCNFKLLLFSFNLSPLSSPFPSTLFRFLSLALLPIKIKQNPSTQTHPSHSNVPRSILVFIKALVLIMIIRAYDYKQYFHPYAILALYCCHMYLGIEIVLAMCAAPARAVFGFEVEPQFNEPYLSTSLQDFWGRRWNLMVTSTLRPTVYNPVRCICTRIIGPRWARITGVISVFVVSGFMHEIIYYYLTRVSPTWEVTWFFVLHGACVAIEIAVKAAVGDKWRLHRAVSGPLAVGFLAVTGKLLFFPQLLRNGVDERAISEYPIMVNFVKNKLLQLYT